MAFERVVVIKQERQRLVDTQLARLATHLTRMSSSRKTRQLTTNPNV
jgi:hypothetical protein